MLFMNDTAGYYHCRTGACQMLIKPEGKKKGEKGEGIVASPVVISVSKGLSINCILLVSHSV